jgi:Baseplate J-like protein
MSTNVPAITWVNGSPVLPSEQTILAGVQADINAAFGGGVNPSLQTPQGQLAQTETAIIGDKNDQIAYIANQVNPSMASGIWQDAIGEIYFITRIPGAGTVVQATCTGAVGTVIPAGAVAQDTNGYLYSLTSAVTIPSGGSITGSFQNQTQGPIACPIGALSTIYTAIAGWDTVSNSSAGALGNDVESRAAFEARRAASVAGNSLNSVQSIYAAVTAVPDVIDAFVVDNPAGTSVSYGPTSYSLAAHSICVSVAGGTSSAVAQAIWNKKPPGCAYNGNTSVTVYDTNYATPVPYTVTYLTPTAVPIYFKVQIQNNSFLPSNIIQLVQNAVLESFNGLDGGTAVGIASTSYSGRYYANINAINPNVNVIEVYLGTTSNPSTLLVALGIDQLPTLSAANIAVNLV